MIDLRQNPFRSEPGIPLYQQLYTHLQTAILSGNLKPGTRLPSTRALAIQLNVSRNTIFNAYQQLIAEGYLDGMVGNGTFVAQILPDHLLTSMRSRSTSSLCCLAAAFDCLSTWTAHISSSKRRK